MPLPTRVLTLMPTISKFFKLINEYGFAPMLPLYFSTCVLPIVHVQEIAKTPKLSKLDTNVQLQTSIYAFKAYTIVLANTHVHMETLVFNAHGFAPTMYHLPPHLLTLHTKVLFEPCEMVNQWST
jgi:hypothetical protein